MEQAGASLALGAVVRLGVGARVVEVEPELWASGVDGRVSGSLMPVMRRTAAWIFGTSGIG